MSLLNCAPCAPSHLRALPIIDTRRTRLRAYALYPSLIRALTLINQPLTRLSCLSAPMQKKINIVRNDRGHAPKMQIFSFRPEIPFLGRFGQKNQNCQSKLKFCTQTNSNMQNSVMMFSISVFDHKYPFWVNLVQKIKIVSLS